MLLKKPYAFLIKYFRVIHIGLTLLLSVGAYKFLNIVSFFNKYVKSGYKTSITIGLSKIYTPTYLYILVFSIIILTFLILILLINKKKPKSLYLFMIIYYIIILLGLFYISSVLHSFETILLDATIARAIRDTIIIIYFPQIVFIAFTTIRAIGFNVKKFDFQNDLKEMNYSSEDAEEVEININFEGYRAKRKARRLSREFIYYIKENKFVVGCLCSIICVAIGVVVYNNMHINYDKNYNTGKEFTFNKLNVVVEESIISNVDYNGNIIDEEKYYLVVKMKISNNSGYAIKMDYNNFKLNFGNKLVTPTLNFADYFVDYAPNNVPNSISHRSEKEFSLVYEISKHDVNRAFRLEIYNGSAYVKGEYIYKHIYVRLHPKKTKELVLNGNYKINEALSFTDTYLKKSSLTVTGYTIAKSYVFDYKKCKGEECKTYDNIISVPIAGDRYNNMLIVLNVNYKQDSSTSYNKSYVTTSAFANNFVTIQYKVGDTVYSDDSLNVTPIEDNSIMAFECNKRIADAQIVQAIVIIRNQKYIINLKS